MKKGSWAVQAIALLLITFVAESAHAGGARCIADGQVQLIEAALGKNDIAQVRKLSRGLAETMQAIVTRARENGDTVVDGIIPLAKLERFARIAQSIGNGTTPTSKVGPSVRQLRNLVDHMWDQPGQQPGAPNCPDGECTVPHGTSTPVPGTH